ncbi:hypothetical protein ACP70R_022444 [Stipagrostis hirtigluma subsp. patula]
MESASRHSRVKIGHAPKLRVLGYLEPGTHGLEVGNAIIKPETKAAPSTIVGSVKILALEVKFRVRDEVKMLPSFLKCFPNIERLYVQSDTSDETGGKLNLKFWQEAGAIDCVQRSLKELVFHEFKGSRNELAFLRFIAERAQILEKMVISVTQGCCASKDQAATTMKAIMASVNWASADCKLTVYGSPFDEGSSPGWTFQGAFDVPDGDPFYY